MDCTASAGIPEKETNAWSSCRPWSGWTVSLCSLKNITLDYFNINVLVSKWCCCCCFCLAADEQIEENAHIIVQQLIHHSECLGPALAGEALGLNQVYSNAFRAMADEDSRDETSSSNGSQKRGPGTLMRRQTTTFQYSRSTSAHDTLIFYTRLIRLLAYCSCEVKQCSDGGADGDVTAGGNEFQPNERNGGTAGLTSENKATNRHKQSIISRTRNILRNLVRVEELVGILSTKFRPNLETSIHPSHKEAVLLFLNRVYGITSPELLVTLISQAFLPDIKYALQLTKVSACT